ncbi:Hypothetical predicted protein [Xyrichtys novacula]|uniref:Uncharacterized protein n=1 Tax=Xyrichtys novacula TaxID=13765 RepID=A0AAV1H9X7_XYRNO|nr:Hypothetical predicted protein [Xyrichtys novacula]
MIVEPQTRSLKVLRWSESRNNGSFNEERFDAAQMFGHMFALKRVSSNRTLHHTHAPSVLTLTPHDRSFCEIDLTFLQLENLQQTSGETLDLLQQTNSSLM